MANTSTKSDLEKFAESGAAGFVKFNENNDPLIGLYLGAEVEADPFNPDRQRVAYSLEIDKEKKIFATGSKRLAKAILTTNPKVGGFIKITRIIGDTPYDTEYEVETSEVPF